MGYVWHRDYGLGFDPDLRLQQAIRTIFERFRILRSARQTHLSLAAEGMFFHRPSDGKRLTSFESTSFSNPGRATIPLADRPTSSWMNLNGAEAAMACDGNADPLYCLPGRSLAGNKT